MLYRDMEDMEKTKIKLLEMKTLMSKMKNTLDRISSRLDIAEEMISEPSDLSVEAMEKWKDMEKTLKKTITMKLDHQKLGDNFRQPNYPDQEVP